MEARLLAKPPTGVYRRGDMLRSPRRSAAASALAPRLVAALAVTLVFATAALAKTTEPGPREDDAFDFMNLLTRHHLHDLEDERWNIYGQITWISSFKLPYHAAYTNPFGTNGCDHCNSLTTDFEHSFTGTATLWLGARLWRGAEAYVVPELVMEKPLSNLTGLGGVIQNFELQKQGSVTPVLYISRLILRQTFDLGGERFARNSDPMKLGTTLSRRRLVITFGNFSILDMMDQNSYAGDLRKQFFNMSFMTYAAYDFAADARGYTYGLVGEFYWDDWVARFGHIVPPQDPNQLPLDFRFYQYFGEQLELEHAHSIKGHPGAVRLLGYLNRENMARFDDAVAVWRANSTLNAADCTSFNYGSRNAGAPDLCWARKPNLKLGIGGSFEQEVAKSIGVFFRGMYSDGQTEVYSYTSTDASISLGILAQGAYWHRRDDYFGAGFSAGWISKAHAQYLALGGIDGFIGDGKLLHQGAESVFEAFYGVNITSSIWISADYQFISNPAYNADRGPLHILGARGHVEF
jgi:high affinity Mn2+ porin